MEEIILWDELAQVMVHDEWYKHCIEAVEDAEGAYLAIYDGLTEEQREQLDHYIAACEAVDDSLIHLAYRLGYQHGKVAFYSLE